MAHRAHEESIPLITPMYYDYPEIEAAYHCPQQYLFGTELIAAPFVAPADEATELSRQVVWLPEGGWYHFFTGEYFEGNQWHAIYGKLDDIPLFAREGAVIPMSAATELGQVGNPNVLPIDIFAGADHSFTLYEHDGETTAYPHGDGCETTFTQRWFGNRVIFTVDTPDCSNGDRLVCQRRRTYRILCGCAEEARHSSTSHRGIRPNKDKRWRASVDHTAGIHI
jgi:alpha-glucosidase (family GH31 glycosyl hydrolase)